MRQALVLDDAGLLVELEDARQPRRRRRCRREDLEAAVERRGVRGDDVRRHVTPGTSALFLLTSDAVEETVVAELGFIRGHVSLIHADLSAEQESRLRDAFGDEDGAA